MLHATVLSMLAWLLATGMAQSQTQLLPDSPVERAIAPGERHDYSLDLSAGDYVAGVADQRGILVFVTIFNPDGTLLRPTPGPNSGPRRFSFVAEAQGRHRISLSVPTVENAAKNGIALPSSGAYRLSLDALSPLAERRKAGASALQSQRLRALRASIAGGGTSDDFWATMRESGTPMVEPVPDDDGQQLVTFLWRGRPDDQSVGVMGTFNSDEFSGRQITNATLLERLDTTDVWFLTLRLPKGARFTYRFAPNDPGTSSPLDIEVRAASLQIDPLNPHRTVERPGVTKFEGASIAELSGAPTTRWAQRDGALPSGTVTPLEVPTAMPPGVRRVWVYTPPSFDASWQHNLAVFFDGELYSSPTGTSAPTILDNLMAANRIAPTIAVFVSSSANRAQELLGNDTFSEFAAMELMPWIRQRFPITNDARRVAIGGISAGGVAAAYTAFRYPTIFGKVLSQSGAFDWSPEHPQFGQPGSDTSTEPNRIARLYRDSPRLPIEFHLEAGTFEADTVGTGGFILEPTRHLRDVLLAKGYVVHYTQFVGGHDVLNARQTLGEALIRLLGPAQ